MIHDHDRNRRKYGKADEELEAWFREDRFVKAQIYDRGADLAASQRASSLHDARLRFLTQKGMTWFDSVAATVAQLPTAHRRIVHLIYTPHGAPTWIADALCPPWGGGSFVVLACCLPRAITAASGREANAIEWPRDETGRRRGVVRAMPKDGQTILDWLTIRGRKAKDPLLTSLREDCEALRLPALGAYEDLRRARVRSELERSRANARRRAEANELLYLELVGRRSRRRDRRARAA